MYCSECCTKYDLKRYNPFYNLINDRDYDNIYENGSTEMTESVEKISETLENCKNFSTAELNGSTHNINEDECFSSYCLNLDGNNTNFDKLTLELASIDTNFSVIGLVETNTSPEIKDLYQIDNYTSCYQTTVPNKKKGTGVALYVHNKFSFEIEQNHSICNDDIETLFVKITNTSEPITIGVVYRPKNLMKSCKIY